MTTSPVLQGALPKLTGTLRVGTHSLAVLQSDDKTRVCAVGEAINGYAVTEVTPFSAFLRDVDGTMHRVCFELAQDGNDVATLDNPDWLSRTNVQHFIRIGEVIGLQITYIVPHHPLSRLGIRSGDILTSLNGHTLKSPEDLHWAYGELRNATTLNFQLERDGQMVPLNIDLSH